MMLMIMLIFWMLTCNLIYRHAEDISQDHLPRVQLLLSNKKLSRKHTPEKKQNQPTKPTTHHSPKPQQEKNSTNWVPKLDYCTVSIKILFFWLLPVQHLCRSSQCWWYCWAKTEEQLSTEKMAKAWMEILTYRVGCCFAVTHALLPILFLYFTFAQRSWKHNW